MTALGHGEAPYQAPLSIGQPLWQRRPAWLEARIGHDFAAAAMIDPREAYGFNGECDQYMFRYRSSWPREDLYVGTGQLTDALEAQQTAGTALRVLDVGCGAGAFVAACLRLGHRAQGLTACDYRRFPEYADIARLEFPDYIIGDAHRLDSVPGMRGTYDLVISQFTVDKLVDPLSAIEQMAGRVAVGGILATDGFLMARPDRAGRWPRGQMLATDLLDMLLRSGFEHIDGDVADYTAEHYRDRDQWGGVAPLILRRTGDEPVRFDVAHADPPLVPAVVGASAKVRYLL